ncbi:butyrophilin subfamily 3 member A1-like [Oncorhynchus keta]|uniref:butyrophilin subfamily 3 member A1-like n=1 Tax=Oncorhynchus keta TaxID=8018 RepID=UPI00227AD9CA|nr:butyrophilin subfamily 3 member A1-like [Oncorhynchus keta]XP_052353522.1 butyrophilin subfamily 3 member A1-like [Oncorhynchus keta]
MQQPNNHSSRSPKDKSLETVEATHSAPWNKPQLLNSKGRDFEKWDAHHSEPWNKPRLNNTKPGLEHMHTFQECLQLIEELSKEVKDISKLARRRGVTGGEGSTASPSLESSRSLILLWAKELDQLQKTSTPTTEVQMMRGKRNPGGGEKDKSLEKENQRILEWATELKNVSEVCGLSDEDLKRLLGTRGVKESRLTGVLPLLEFIAWSVLSNDTEEDVSKLWLTTKQRAWRTGSQKYIPNSVWQWIHSASTQVRLEPLTSHPWLAFSDDNLEVWEAPQRRDTINYPLRFDSWPCVLGCQAINTGRHYWGVEVSPTGSWRLGLTSVTAPRKGRFPMTPAKGYWTLWRSAQNNLWACCDDPLTKLPVSALPHLVGVYLDFEEGQVSFYDIENRSHIYTFTDTFKEKVVPVFGCLDGETKIRIVPWPKMPSASASGVR